VISPPLKRGWQAHKDSNLSLARAYVKQYAPYLTSTLYGLIPTPVENMDNIYGGPMGVSERLVLYYDPAWVDSVSVGILATGLAHECFHDQLRHVKRGKAYPNPKLFNIAADLFINGTMLTQTRQVRVQGSGRISATTTTMLMWEFPEWAVMPEKFGFKTGLTADEYYALLEELEKEQAKKKPKPGKGGQAGQADGDSNGAAGESPDGEPQPGQNQSNGSGSGGHSHGHGDNQIMSGCCGGVAGNALSREFENTKNEEVGRSEADCKSIARETSRAIKKHMEAQKGRGDTTGNWSELVEISDTVFVVPWRSKLANVTRDYIGRIRSGGMDYSMRRPSKRSYLRGIILPSLISYDPNIAFIIDSSGSMGSKELSDAKRVVADVMMQTGIQKVWYMEADTKQQRDLTQLSIHELRDIPILGRGGTDFRPAIKYINEFRPRMHIVIYVTDGDGAAPANAPDRMKFIWCIVPSSKTVPAPWGETILLSDAVAA